MNLFLKSLQISEGKQTNHDVYSQRSEAMKSIALIYKNGNGVAKDNAAYRQ